MCCCWWWCDGRSRSGDGGSGRGQDGSGGDGGGGSEMLADMSIHGGMIEGCY